MGIHKRDKLHSFDADNKTAVQWKMSSNDIKKSYSLTKSRVWVEQVLLCIISCVK